MNMIAIAIIFLVLPIFLRSLIDKVDSISVSFKILFPTCLAYSIWFFFSLLLIISDIKLSAYLVIFCLFATLFVIHELGWFFINRKNIKFNSLAITFILFLLVFFFFSIFVFTLFGDATTYMKFGIESKISNSFAIDSEMYRYNSFYYIATIFGLYEMQFFYSIFVQLIFAIFILFPIIEIIKIRFNKLDKPIILFLIALIISLISCSLYSAGANWLIGFVAALFLLIALFAKPNHIKNIFYFDFMLFVNSMFFMNFSLTALVTGLAFYFLLIMYRLFFQTFSWKEFFLLPIIILLVIISITNHNNSIFQPIFISFWFFIFLGVICLFWYFRKKNFEFDFRLKKTKLFKYFINWKWTKFHFLIMLCFFYFLCLATQVILFFTSKNFSGINSNLSNYRQLIHLCLYEFFGLFFIYLAFYTKNFELLLFFAIIVILTIMYIIIGKITSKIPYYVTDRVRYSFNAITIVFTILMSLNLTLKKLKFIPLTFLPLAFSFSAINDFNMLTDIYFSTRILENKKMISETDMDFLTKNYSYIGGRKKIFSEVEYPFSPSNESYFYWYDREINFSKGIKKSLFAYGSAWSETREERYKEYENFVNNNLNETSYFDAIILKSNSIFVNKNITSQYHPIKEKNINLIIWIKN